LNKHNTVFARLPEVVRYMHMYFPVVDANGI